MNKSNKIAPRANKKVLRYTGSKTVVEVRNSLVVHTTSTEGSMRAFRLQGDR